MSVMVGANESQDELTDALVAYIFKTALATTSIHLYKNDVTPGIATKVADLVEADFTGYASLTVAAWDGTSVDPLTGLRQIITGTGPQFTQTGTTITNTVFGMWIEFNGKIVLAERFDNPVAMDLTGKRIDLFPKIFTGLPSGPGSFED
jgi:hypothetical protein